MTTNYTIYGKPIHDILFEDWDDEKRFAYQTALIKDTMKKHNISEGKPIIVRFTGDWRDTIDYCYEDIDEVIECLAIKDGIDIADDRGTMAIIAYYNGKRDIAEIIRNTNDNDFDEYGDFITYELYTI